VHRMTRMVVRISGKCAPEFHEPACNGLRRPGRSQAVAANLAAQVAGTASIERRRRAQIQVTDGVGFQRRARSNPQEPKVRQPGFEPRHKSPSHTSEWRMVILRPSAAMSFEVELFSTGD
jgi:hypothetical protein